MTDVTIADGDSELQCGDHAFYNAWIETLYLGRNITNNPFADNESLKNLTISNTVTTLPNEAFSGCSGLTAIDIPDSVTSIGDEAFSYCSGLSSLNIPPTVSSIGNYAFYNCTALGDVIFADSEDTLALGAAVFTGSPVNSLYVGRNLSGADFSETNLTDLTIGESVTIIDKYAFNSCAGITKLTIPASVNFVGDFSFTGCLALTDVTIADGDKMLQFGSTVFGNTDLETLYLGRSFSGSPFKNSTSLKNLTISNSVTTIPNYAFNGCSALTAVTVAEGNSELTFGNSVFDRCPIETVYLGRNTAGFSPFENILSLTTLNIGDKVSSIANGAFMGCNGLTSLTLPASVNEIGEYAFSGCSGLNEIACEPMTPPSANSNSFDETTYTSATLSVPEEAKATYLSDPVWRKFKSIHILVESITLDPDAFKGKPGDSFQIKATILPADATNSTLQWSSSNEDIATVDSEGNVTILTAGDCEITATSTDGSDISATCSVESVILVESITLDPDAFKGKPGDSFQIKATILPADATNSTLQWSSSNDIIASVDQDGTVTLNREGYCEITAKATDGSEAEAICVIDILTGAGLVDIDNEVDVEVYNLEGSLIARSLKRLPAGFYIIKQGSTVAKIRI